MADISAMSRERLEKTYWVGAQDIAGYIQNILREGSAKGLVVSRKSLSQARNFLDAASDYILFKENGAQESRYLMLENQYKLVKVTLEEITDQTDPVYSDINVVFLKSALHTLQAIPPTELTEEDVETYSLMHSFFARIAENGKREYGQYLISNPAASGILFSSINL